MKGVFCGTFDPVTRGHMDIIERASKLFDELYVVVTPNSDKHTMFSDEFRKTLIEGCCEKLGNVSVLVTGGLATAACRNLGANVLIRSLRSEADYAYEQNMADMNALIAPHIETIFLCGRPEHSAISSSNVREFLRYGLDISALVPEKAALMIKEETEHENDR